MRFLPGISLKDVQSVYAGPERRLWELLMGEQIHIGGLRSSSDLARQAGIASGQRGVDLCCASGAGMRFLLRFCSVDRMIGVDATPQMLALGRERASQEGFSDRMYFVEADVCATGLPAAQADFVWGEDAWCYVQDKSGLIAEASRLIKPGGRIAFTDWMEGDQPFSDGEAERFMRFMKFPSLFTLPDYSQHLESCGLHVQVANDTDRFRSHASLYVAMIEQQLTYDALKIIGFDSSLAESLLGEMRFMETLAREGKICQGLVIASKPV